MGESNDLQKNDPRPDALTQVQEQTEQGSLNFADIMSELPRSSSYMVEPSCGGSPVRQERSSPEIGRIIAAAAALVDGPPEHQPSEKTVPGVSDRLPKISDVLKLDDKSCEKWGKDLADLVQKAIKNPNEWCKVQDWLDKLHPVMGDQIKQITEAAQKELTRRGIDAKVDIKPHKNDIPETSYNELIVKYTGEDDRQRQTRSFVDDREAEDRWDRRNQTVEQTLRELIKDSDEHRRLYRKFAIDPLSP